jgi:hypothetical protein
MRILVLSLLILSACGPEETSVDVEGCEHLADGPAAPVTATDAPSLTASPAVDLDHRRYDVTLPALSGGSGRGGYVRFAPSEATDYVIFLGTVVPMTITDASGASVPIETTVDGSEECSEIARKHTVELAPGTYFLFLGGQATPATSVSVVLEEAAGHEH